MTHYIITYAKKNSNRQGIKPTETIQLSHLVDIAKSDAAKL